jgi:ABC-type dipeptide/oligopeptide/nickel transport system permease subunit
MGIKAHSNEASSQQVCARRERALDADLPASFLAVTLFCFNFIGDGLRDALDPKDR